MQRRFTLKIMAFLAFVQGLAGILRAFNWFETGLNLFGEGLLLLPFVGALAILRGLLVATLALFYVLFAVGAIMAKGWARWVGLTAAIINLFLVLSVLLQGADLGHALIWSVVPVLLVVYLISNASRKPIIGK